MINQINTIRLLLYLPGSALPLSGNVYHAPNGGLCYHAPRRNVVNIHPILGTMLSYLEAFLSPTTISEDSKLTSHHTSPTRTTCNPITHVVAVS